MRFTVVGISGDTFIVGYSAGDIKVWDLTGAAYTVDTPDGSDYVSDDMVFHADVEAGHIKCLSRTQEVAMSDTIAGYPLNAAVATCLGALFDRTYSITLTASNGDSHTVSYTTPDGTTSGDALLTSATNVMTELETEWNAATLPAGFAATTLERHEGVLVWTDTNPLVITASDGDSGDTIRYIDSTVKDATHLPSTAKHGHTVLVTGGRSEDDDYFLRFDSDVTDTVGDGFGSEGVWREAADPTIDNEFDVSTLPHSLELDTVAKTATFSQIAWQPRRVGDENTNPTPPFVGSRIRDMVVFENRLLVISGSTVYTTRSDHTDDFWRRSATVQANSDPLDFRSTAADGETLDWIVPFDRDLLLVADPGSAQFVIRGGGLTPSNASMVLTTEYEVDAGIRPVSTGRTVILPYRNGQYIGVNEFFTQEETSANAADPLTAVQPRYIRGPINGLVSAENFSRFSITSETERSTLWVYRYLWDTNQRLQSAWYKLAFTDTILSHFYDASYMYVLLRPTGSAADATLVRMDMNRLDYEPTGFHITLDRKEQHFVNAAHQITVNHPDALIVQSTGCTSPGLLALQMDSMDNGDGTYTITLDADMCPDGAHVISGQAVNRTLEPTMPQARNFQGEVVSNAKLNIRHFMLHMEDSPDVKATRNSVYRAAREFYPRVTPVDNDPLDPDRLGKRDYVLKVPWREATDKSSLTVTCDDIRPDTILEIEWAGDLRGVRRRV
jgi:hypothetical protein